MGRIRGKSFWTRKREDYKSRDVGQEQFVKNMENVGSILKLGTELYTNPMIRDAVGGLEDLFQGSPEEQKDVVTTAAESQVSNLKKAALARRQDAMGDFQEAQGQVPVGPPQGPVQMPTAPTAGMKEVQDLTTRSAAAGRVGGFLADQALGSEQRATSEQLLMLNRDREAIVNAIKSQGPSAELAHQLYTSANQRYHLVKSLAETSDPQQTEEYLRQLDDIKAEMDSAKSVIDQHRGLKDTKAAIDDADTAAQLRMSNIQALKDELKAKATSKAQQLSAMAYKKAAELNQGTEEAVASAVDQILSGRKLPPENQAKFDDIKSKLIVDPETGDIMLNVTTEERVAISNDPEMSVYLAAATKQLEQDLQRSVGTYATGGDLGSALAGLEEAGAEPFVQPAGPTGAGEEVATTVTEEVATTPTATRLIGDETPVDLPGAVTAENFRKIQDDVALDYITYKPEINDAIDKLKAIYGPGAFGSTPQEVQATIRTISQTFGGGVPAQGIEVPDIAGRSLQEAQMIAMEIGQNPNVSFKAKQAAMRELLKQVSSIEDVTSDWASNYGTAGYVGTSAAANSLMNAFSGQIPKPKATRAPSLSEQIKLARLPDIQESDKLKNVKARQGVIREELALPHDIKKKLLDATKGYQNLKLPKTGGGGRSGAGKKDLKELEKRLERNANSDRKFFQSSQERIKTQVTGLQNLTVAKIMDDKSNQQIATEYGPDLARYLQDVRNAKTDAEKQAALKKAKTNIRNDLRARAKALKANQVKLAELVRRLNVELLQKDLKKKEATLREINELWADIQKGI